MKRSLASISPLLLILALSITGLSQNRKAKARWQPSEVEVNALADDIETTHGEVIKAAQSYGESLVKLLVFQEGDVKTATETVERRKALVDQQIVSKRELEESERLLASARAKVAETKRQIAEGEQMVTAGQQEHASSDWKAEARAALLKRHQERTARGQVYFVCIVIIGEIEISNYSGAINGRVVKQRGRVTLDSRTH